MARKIKGPIYQLDLVPVPRWANPPPRRLAKLLKAIERAYGFRCISFRQIGADPETEQPAPQEEMSV